MNRIEKVKEFMTASGQEIGGKINIPSKEVCNLRIGLLLEEVRELTEAFAAGDIVEVFDAFQDIQYVLDGAILTCGMHTLNDAGFQEVHRSNMSKFCKTEDEAQQTVVSYLKQNVDVDYKKVGNFYVVYRKEDNKTLKSINYSPADLKTLINFQMRQESVLGNQTQLPLMSNAEAEKEFAPFKVATTIDGDMLRRLDEN